MGGLIAQLQKTIYSGNATARLCEAWCWKR